MPTMPTILIALAFLLSTPFATALSLSTPGIPATIPNWHIASSSLVGNNATTLSQPRLHLDVTQWTQIGSRATLMGGLIEAGKYNDQQLFFSNNLEKFDSSQFRVPWWYRHEFTISQGNGSVAVSNSSYHLEDDKSFYQLRTHGISSAADIYLNGALVVDRNGQAGAYVGRVYDITELISGGKRNVLLIRVYPTDYLRDLAIGFVDWNPYPPDNGTGIWRDVEFVRTGRLGISEPRVLTKNATNGTLVVTFEVRNWDRGGKEVDGEVRCEINDPEGRVVGTPMQDVRLRGNETRSVQLTAMIKNPGLWWPKQWGSQPLYSIECSVSIRSGNTLKLSALSPAHTFGIRTVTSSINSHNDRTFSINSQPIQILGAGYTSDIFLRFSAFRARAQISLALSMGLNTLRLEGKQEHPKFYQIADELGMLILPGWECCDKWEGWPYNDEGSGDKWVYPTDYQIAERSMRHEAQMMQRHPSVMGFLVGSDFWPDERATKRYVHVLSEVDWETPVIASASKRGYPTVLGPGGMKMEGPYDWVPPSYWTSNSSDLYLGAAFGFASELSASVGTPELPSLRRFLSERDLEDLWTRPEKGLWHMSTNVSSFYDRGIYNDALWKRFGTPMGLEDYLWKAQMMDFEASRAQFEGYAMRWNAERPATGVVYWMLNNAWPGLHWQLFDYYGGIAGAGYGVKTGLRMEHVAYDYSRKSIYVINRTLNGTGTRSVVVDVEIVGLDGKRMFSKTVIVTAEPSQSKEVLDLKEMVDGIKDVGLLRLVLRGLDKNGGEEVRSRNVYFLTSSSASDLLDWANSTWYYTPTTRFANYTSLNWMRKAGVGVKLVRIGDAKVCVELENRSTVPAVFVRLMVWNGKGEALGWGVWEDNYVTLWPGERVEVGGSWDGSAGEGVRVEVKGWNVDAVELLLGE